MATARKSADGRVEGEGEMVGHGEGEALAVCGGEGRAVVFEEGEVEDVSEVRVAVGDLVGQCASEGLREVVRVGLWVWEGMGEVERQGRGAGS